MTQYAGTLQRSLFISQSPCFIDLQIWQLLMGLKSSPCPISLLHLLLKVLLHVLCLFNNLVSYYQFSEGMHLIPSFILSASMPIAFLGYGCNLSIST